MSPIVHGQENVNHTDTHAHTHTHTHRQTHTPTPTPTPTHRTPHSPAHTHSALSVLLSPDKMVYLRSREMAEQHKRRIPDYHTQLALFRSTQARVDQNCSFTAHDSKVLRGKDCYTLPPAHADRP